MGEADCGIAGSPDNTQMESSDDDSGSESEEE